MIVTVDTAKLVTPELLARYAKGRDYPYCQGMRQVMDLLGIELPEPLQRRNRGCKRNADPSRMTLWRDKQKAAQAGATHALDGLKP